MRCVDRRQADGGAANLMRARKMDLRVPGAIACAISLQQGPFSVKHVQSVPRRYAADA